MLFRKVFRTSVGYLSNKKLLFPKICSNVTEAALQNTKSQVRRPDWPWSRVLAATAAVIGVNLYICWENQEDSFTLWLQKTQTREAEMHAKDLSECKDDVSMKFDEIC